MPGIVKGAVNLRSILSHFNFIFKLHAQTLCLERV